MAFILIVDDHKPVADAVAALFSLEGHQVAAVHSGPAALQCLRSRRVDLVVLKESVPGMSGTGVRSLVADGTLPPLPVVMFSADERAGQEALSPGARIRPQGRHRLPSRCHCTPRAPPRERVAG